VLKQALCGLCELCGKYYVLLLFTAKFTETTEKSKEGIGVEAFIPHRFG
jgi:hypothetical protein